MKKNYFNLTKKEREEYYKEFKQTPVGKEVSIISNSTKVTAQLIMVVLIVAIFVIAIFGDIDNTSEYTIINTIIIALIAYLISLYLYLYSKSHLESNFTKWLKLEHKIEK